MTHDLTSQPCSTLKASVL